VGSRIPNVEPTTPDYEDAVPPTTDLSGEAPTVAINTGLLPTMAQHCTRCGATLAADQRYCVVCGERRGEPRLPFMDGRTPANGATMTAPPVMEAPAAPPAASKSRFSAGTTLIAGVATLLLALGVGVLIGNAGKKDNGSAAAAAPSVITVNSGGGGAAVADTATTATTSTTSKASSSKKDTKAAAAKTDTKSAAEQQAAAKAVVSAPAGSEIPQAAAPKVTQGQKGTGPGYKDGKFTGDFFGG
jgi:hypothetical protein